MFEWIPVLFSLIVLSIDGYIIGFLLGLKRIRTKFHTLLLISFFTSLIMLVALFLGDVAGEFIPGKAIALLSGILLIGIGIYQFINDPPMFNDSFLIKIALIINMDGLAYGIQAGMNGRSYSFSIFVGFFLLAAFILGIVQGYSIKNSLIVSYISVLPAIIFILLGLSKILVNY